MTAGGDRSAKKKIKKKKERSCLGKSFGRRPGRNFFYFTE
jgi:hypothetical protein